MNIRRGIFRLALILSISAGIILPLCLLEKHPWVTCSVLRYEYEKEEIDKAKIAIENQYPERSGQSKIAKGKIYELLKDKGQWYGYEFKWNGRTSYNKRGEISIEASPVELVGICDEMSKINKIMGVKAGVAYSAGFYPGNSYSTENKFFDDPDWEEHLMLTNVITHINWNRFFLVMAISFASVWFLYAFVRLVIIGFILEGFKNKSLKGGETE